MNSLNFVSARVSPPSSPGPTRSNSLTSMGLTVTSQEEQQSAPAEEDDTNEKSSLPGGPDEYYPSHPHDSDPSSPDERTPLLASCETKAMGVRQTTWHLIPRRIASAFVNSLRWVFSALTAPGVYLIACLYDEDGNFSPLLPLTRLFGAHRKQPRESAAGEKRPGGLLPAETINTGRGGAMSRRTLGSSGSSSSGLSSESESDPDRTGKNTKASGRRDPRARSLQGSEEINPSRRSIRIKLHNEESLRQRKQKKSQSASPRGGGGGGAGGGGGSPQKDISAHLKSPTSPAGALTKYPRTPAPPRPLIPRRQPSYINVEASGLAPQKTLILDLDETLIHSMSKGNRMSSGHMVEVKLNTTYVGVGGQASIGPQHPILYYVHKRPYCDDFLRRVSVPFFFFFFADNAKCSI